MRHRLRTRPQICTQGLEVHQNASMPPPRHGAWGFWKVSSGAGPRSESGSALSSHTARWYTELPFFHDTCGCGRLLIVVSAYKGHSNPHELGAKALWSMLTLGFTPVSDLK